MFMNTLLLEGAVDGGILFEGMRCRKHWLEGRDDVLEQAAS